MARILLGVSGGVAAYKALEFVRLATGAGHAVRVLQTPASRRFVGEASFAALTGAPVLVGEFDRDPLRGAFPGDPSPAHAPLSHLELAARADVYLVAPASANTIAKLAAGIADSMLTSCALAVRCPLVIAPAMNNNMYEHAATRANVATLRERGAHLVEPGVGRLASAGEHGVGRLAEPQRLLEVCEALLAGRSRGPSAAIPPGSDGERAAAQSDGERAAAQSDGERAGARSDGERAWRGVRVLVTAGGTREPIDSVRFVGNSSSGRMGLALAAAARDRGAEVTVLAANVALARPAGVAWREVRTAADLARACEEEFPSCHVLLMAAAVADFAPAQAAERKIKKRSREALELTLAPTPDVLAALAAVRSDGQTLVGFAAEHGEGGLAEARRKLEQKSLDAVVLNDISRADIGFDSEHNEVTVLAACGTDRALREWHVPRASKPQVAEALLDIVGGLRGSG